MYAQPDHRFCRRWAVMTDPEETLGASGAGIKVGEFADFVAFYYHMINYDILDMLQSFMQTLPSTYLPTMIKVDSVCLSVFEKVHSQVLTNFVTFSFIRAT